ncbi:7082_t:CDS:1, partial [Ambispora leptoticha]
QSRNALPAPCFSQESPTPVPCGEIRIGGGSGHIVSLERRIMYVEP